MSAEGFSLKYSIMSFHSRSSPSSPSVCLNWSLGTAVLALVVDGCYLAGTMLSGFYKYALTLSGLMRLLFKLSPLLYSENPFCIFSSISIMPSRILIGKLQSTLNLISGYDKFDGGNS